VPFSISPKVSRQKNCLVVAKADVMLLRHSVIVVIMESVAMSEHRADTPEQVLKFVPKEWPNSYGSQVKRSDKPRGDRAAASGSRNVEPSFTTY
jgi:hypothetical protein